MDKNTKNLKFTIHEIKFLSAQLKILPLLIEFLKSGEIRFDEFYGSFSPDEGIQYIKDLEKRVKIELEIQQDLTF
ncbi:hypothetical protein ACQKOM_21990 [Peribacillus frigoritolerans]|uniref:hypothetical protein n=1 Tax=Peribacillus frigoritolerans TaxID=450367 RepID=UPI003D0007D4